MTTIRRRQETGDVRRQNGGGKRQAGGRPWSRRAFPLAVLVTISVCSLLPAVSVARTGIQIKNAFVRAAAHGMSSAAYFTVMNTSTAPDTLYKAEASFAGMSQLHETYTENGMVGMRGIRHIIIPARSRFEFRPGDYHVMLMNLKRDLKPGEKVDLKLFFRRGGVVTVRAVVRK